MVVVVVVVVREVEVVGTGAENCCCCCCCATLGDLRGPGLIPPGVACAAGAAGGGIVCDRCGKKIDCWNRD